MSYIDTQNLLPEVKTYLLWIKEDDSQALKYACRQLNNSYQKRFKQQGGKPKFKSEKDTNRVIPPHMET